MRQYMELSVGRIYISKAMDCANTVRQTTKQNIHKINQAMTQKYINYKQIL